MAALMRKALTQTTLSLNGKHGIQFIRLGSCKIFFLIITITTNLVLSFSYSFTTTVLMIYWIYIDWNKDWKPGPYPKTQAERAAAAKKYGLLLQDYEPYPDDGMGYGDYPKLPLVSNDQRDPFVNWDYPDLKRNFGEPVSSIKFLSIMFRYILLYLQRN